VFGSQHRADVVVVGAGVIGLAIAWRAALRGMAVLVLERGAPGAGASHVAAGMLAPVAEAEPTHRALLELSLGSAARYEAFAAELEQASGRYVGLRACGTLMAARDADEAEALERLLTFRLELGLSVARLRPSEARELEPALAPALRLALHLPDDHAVDPRLLSAALRVALGRAGGQLRAGAAVEALEVSGERVTGVVLHGGERVAAGRVVVAAGAWSGAIGGLPEEARLPIRPVKGQILRLRDPAGPGLLDRVLRTENAYLVPRGDGRYVLGGTMEERGFDTSVTAGAVLDLLHEVAELVPGVAELELVETSAGLRPATPDNAPAIGHGAVDGLVWAAGHHRNGVLLAPITAEIAAAALADEPLPALASAFAPTRFATAVPA